MLISFCFKRSPISIHPNPSHLISAECFNLLSPPPPPSKMPLPVADARMRIRWRLCHVVSCRQLRRVVGLVAGLLILWTCLGLLSRWKIICMDRQAAQYGTVVHRFDSRRPCRLLVLTGSCCISSKLFNIIGNNTPVNIIFSLGLND